MRNGQNKRMRGRNRKGGHHQNPLSRMYESNGPDVKIRGTASHVAEKYLQLARDAQSSGDPVAAENYYQHAEHYFRLIAAAQEQFRQSQPYYQQSGEPRGNAARRRLRRRQRTALPSAASRLHHASRSRSIRASNTTSRRSRSTRNRGRSNCRRPARKTLNGCRRSSPAASRNSRRRSNPHNKAKGPMALKAKGPMAPMATTVRRTDFRCTAGGAGIAARAIMPCRARAMGRCPPVRVRSTTERSKALILQSGRLWISGSAFVAARNDGAQPPRGALASRTRNQIGTTITAPSRK